MVCLLINSLGVPSCQMVPIRPKNPVELLRVQFRVDMRTQCCPDLAFIHSNPTIRDAKYSSRCLKPCPLTEVSDLINQVSTRHRIYPELPSFFVTQWTSTDLSTENWRRQLFAAHVCNLTAKVDTAERPTLHLDRWGRWERCRRWWQEEPPCQSVYALDLLD